MPAAGIVLMIIGLWVVIRALRGNLGGSLTRKQGKGGFAPISGPFGWLVGG
jgi:hypothetical protein